MVRARDPPRHGSETWGTRGIIIIIFKTRRTHTSTQSVGHSHSLTHGDSAKLSYLSEAMVTRYYRPWRRRHTSSLQHRRAPTVRTVVRPRAFAASIYDERKTSDQLTAVKPVPSWPWWCSSVLLRSGRRRSPAANTCPSPCTRRGPGDAITLTHPPRSAHCIRRKNAS